MRQSIFPPSAIVDSQRQTSRLGPRWRRGKFKSKCFVAILGLSLILFGHIVSSQCMAQSGVQSQAQLYFFTDHGCAPCRQVEPGIEALKLEGYPVKTVFLSEHRELGRRLGVDRTPTVVLLTGNQMAGRHAGLIDAVTLKKWFAAVGVTSGTMFAQASDKLVGGTKIVMADQGKSASGFSRSNASAISGFSTPTMLEGTPRPGNEIERLALQATVKLKVEDPKGISYATGTVIHNHQGECLVMTCGHVFREAGEDGVITAQYGFDKIKTKTATGQLIFYDADARDIGLVAIRTDEEIKPVPIAPLQSKVKAGRNVFSIGCDHGDDPTIRHSEIKNRAAYDGAIKYDIFGRPVDGRSGGGLFNEDGELIGVCNAAAVEVDEGIYTALETLHWQIAKVNLEHLFKQEDRVSQQDLASSTSPRKTMPAVIRPKSELAALNGQGRTLVGWDRRSRGGEERNVRGSDQEVIIIVRSKSDPAQADAITVSDPGPRLLEYLRTMQRSRSEPTRQLDMAQLRQTN